MCLCEGKEESVNSWNNRGVIAVPFHFCVHCLLSFWSLSWGAAVGSTDKTHLSALQRGQDAL